MSNWFATIGQASTGLNAARYGLSVVSQNIENADTDGYTRQTAQQSALDGTARTGLYAVRTGQVEPAGVAVTATSRSDDPVLDARLRTEHGIGAMADATASTLTDLEGVVGEPSDTGLASQLTSFWTAWGAVANDPGNTGTRTVLLRAAGSAAQGLNDLSTSIAGVATGVSGELDSDLSQATQAAQQLATLNGQIAVASATGQNANPLLDTRDKLLTTLSTLVGGVASIDATGAATVTVGGQTLVSGTTASTMSADAAHQVSVGGSAVTLTGGSAAARVTALTVTIPGYQAKLDAVANALATSANAVQAGGYDLAGNAGTPLFTGSGAAGIAVAITDPSELAASATAGGNLDGSNAARAVQAGAAAGGAEAQFAALVGDLGTSSAQATQRQTTQDTIVSGLDAMHASINGVSYDEEVSSMLTYQHAFQASSRVLTTVDEMLDTLINHTGVVGRG